MAENRLIKNMYGSEFDGKSNLFDLRCGQMRSQNQVVHNGGWYNKQGEKLGWGDLSSGDLTRISRELLPGELFAVLSEGDSFWNFVTTIGPLGSMCTSKPDAMAPGVEYVAEKCWFVIVPRYIYLHVNDGSREGKFGLRGGLVVDCLSSKDIRALFDDRT